MNKKINKNKFYGKGGKIWTWKKKKKLYLMCLQQDLKWLSRRLTFPFLPWDTYCSQVRIRVLWVQTAVVLDVLESLVHQTAVAALVALGSRTVHQVLLAQRHQFTSLPEVLTLQGSGGAEGPARATLTLKERERRWKFALRLMKKLKGLTSVSSSSGSSFDLTSPLNFTDYTIRLKNVSTI